jgi:Tol biopolymer transport system component
MTRKYRLWTVLLLSSGVLSACGGSTDSAAPPTTGTLDFNVVTTGVDIAANGFLLSVDGAFPGAIPANGNLSLSMSPGTHTLAISGLAFNCNVTTASASADVILGTTTRVDVRASCTPYLGNVIIYTSEQFGLGELMAMRPDGSRRERITTDQAGYAAAVVSPDGQSIATASSVGGSWAIYLLDRFGKGRTKLVGRSTFDGSPAWSPDGTKIAFRSVTSISGSDYGRIFIINRDGTGLRQLTPTTPTDYGYEDGPSWSPDGTRVVYGKSGALMVINADGTGLTSLGVAGWEPAWSPDGTHVAYETLAGVAPTAIFVMDANGANARRVTPDGGDQWPRWSPDGQHLVFQRPVTGIFQLYMIGADGTGETKLSAVLQV